MSADDLEARLRTAVFAWLTQRSEHGEPVLRRDALMAFEFDGHRLPLVDPQRGIRKPRGRDAALSVRTTYTPPNEVPPYEDAVGADGLLRYKYRGTDPSHYENVALRVAMQQQLPIVWFYGIESGVYLPIYPVWVVADDPSRLEFTLALDEAQRAVATSATVTPLQRDYVQRLTRLRLHQPVFRARVLRAYHTTCAMCRLKHPELLDAAHILPDGHPRGLPVVPNGLALCKIHHTAFDVNILGVRPDLVVEVRSDVLEEHDGPMLRHGLQEMAGVRLLVPHSIVARPDRAALEERYEEFRTPA